MRIVIANWSARKVGGTESYLDTVIPAIARAGHNVALFCEFDLPANRTKISLPPDCEVWCASILGADRALAQMRAWKADLIYSHALTDPGLEGSVIEDVPAVLFSHSYLGTCISGDKTFRFPRVKPCTRRFGWQCLLHFYPRRCGGLDPRTMWSLFRTQVSRLQLMRRYRRIIVASDHMRREFLRHGLAPNLVKTIPLPVEVNSSWLADDRGSGQHHGEASVQVPCISAFHGNEVAGVSRENGGEWRLLFAGRMDPLKGGLQLMESLPLISATLERPIRLTLVGDGPARVGWEERARRLLAQNAGLGIDFEGWIEGADFGALVASCDLLVMPSLWPEPFGLGGPEAGLWGLPAAAFAVGGIPEWLSNGVNGYLAPGDPPTAQGLAEAIIRCLRDPDEYARLRVGAIDRARRFSLAFHVAHLLDVLADVTGKQCDAR